jgi:hypothetical protein
LGDPFIGWIDLAFAQATKLAQCFEDQDSGLGQRGQGNLVLYACACTRLPTLPPEEFGDVFGGADKLVCFTRLIGAPEPMFERSFFETSS